MKKSTQQILLAAAIGAVSAVFIVLVAVQILAH
jgi:hypothetical protein